MAEGACCALGEGQDGQAGLARSHSAWWEGQAQGAGATEGCGPHHRLHCRILPTTYEYLLASCPPPGDREDSEVLSQPYGALAWSLEVRRPLTHWL